MDKNLSIFYRIINKNVLEWFLLIISKVHTLRTSAKLSRNQIIMFLIKKRRSVDAQYLLLTLWIEVVVQNQKQPLEVFSKKGVLENFSKFTEKHLCLSLLFNKVAGLRLLADLRLLQVCNFKNFKKSSRAPVLQDTFGRLLLKNPKSNSWTVTFPAYGNVFRIFPDRHFGNHI